MIHNTWPWSKIAPQRRPALKRRQPTRCFQPRLEEMESRQLLSASPVLESAAPLLLGDTYTGAFNTTPAIFAMQLPDAGRLTVELVPEHGTTRLALLSSTGQLLMQSNGTVDDTSRIDVHLLPQTTYYLSVESLDASTGAYDLGVSFTPTLPPHEPLPVGDSPWSSTTSDFNNDGRADLAVANFNGNSVTVYLGVGDGSFTTGVSFTCEAGPNAIVAGDWNGDKVIDLATANLYGDSVSLLLGVGDGAFMEARHYAAGSGAAWLVAGDFNADGAPDFAVADLNANEVAILLNHGDGTLAGPVAYAVGTSPYGVAAGDFTGDGNLDLVALNYDSDDVTLLLGDGHGAFSPGVTVAVGHQPYAPVAGDFNADGQLDLAVANYGSSDMSILHGDGHGHFTVRTLAVGPGPSAVSAADFNGDGRLDLATANLADGTVSILLADATGQPAVRRDVTVGVGSSSLAVADYNRDGAWDLAVTDLTPNTVEIVLGRGDGSFQTQPAQSPGTQVFQVASADFNRDGLADLVTVNYATNDVMIRLGQADGSFRFGGRFAIGSDPVMLSVGDLNGDHAPDVVTANFSTSNVSVLLNTGDGTLLAPQQFAATGVPEDVVLADMNGDGTLDVVVADSGSGGIALLLNDGTGMLAAPIFLASGPGAVAVEVGDFTGDGRLDLAVANQEASNVTIFIRQADGRLEPVNAVATDEGPAGIALGDFNGDGRLDLAVGSETYHRTTVFLGDGSGAFAPSPVGAIPGLAPLAGDFDRDGHLDLATIDRTTSQLLVHAGAGSGAFALVDQLALGEFAYRGTVADVNRDSILDLVIANQNSNVATFLGRGDGTFEPVRKSPVIGGPLAIVGADFNSDGQLDVATANPTTGAVSVSLSSGDGLFTAASSQVLAQPVALASADFNRDGRPDLVAAEYLSNSITVLFGVGDGAMTQSQTYSVGSRPVAIVSADLNRNGLMDLAVANYASNSVSILLNQGNGTFELAAEVSVGAGPVALVAADVDGDGIVDLVTANSLAHSLTILAGDGRGAFGEAGTCELASVPSAVTVGDFNHDDIADLAVACQAANEVAVLLGTGEGRYRAPTTITVPGTVALTASDFDRDGRLDLLVAGHDTHEVQVLLGQGDGAFHLGGAFPVGAFPSALAAGDFNRDGRLDFASANGLGAPVSVGLGLADGAFMSPELAANPTHGKPLLADFDHDGHIDVAVLRQDGAVQVRFGHGEGVFHPPIVINPGPTDAAQQIGLVRASGDVFLATLSMAGNHLQVYAGIAEHAMAPSFFLPLPVGLATHMLITDLTGDGDDDLIFADAGARRILVYTQESFTAGSPPLPLDVGPSPSNLAVADVNGDGRPDLLVTDQFSGDVRVLHGTGDGHFAAEQRFRAGVGLVDVDIQSQVRSYDAPVALLAGSFDSQAGDDLLILNRGVNRLAFLRSDGHGGFFNPVSPLGLATGSQPIDLVAGHFDADAHLDVAVLNQDSQDVAIFRGDGTGNFVKIGNAVAGKTPSGLAAADINGDGRLDLLVGNEHGDVLTLLGNGNGTFRAYERLDRRVSLAVGDLNGSRTLAWANQAQDRVTIQLSHDVGHLAPDRQDGLLAPSAVVLADVNADQRTDLLVANGGGNEVLVFLGDVTGQLGQPQRYFVGTNPSSLTLSDLNADGILDLVVANTGSNDVSTFLGKGVATGWSFVQGPRLEAGHGPSATAVADVDGDWLPDILVANSVSNDVYILHGVGAGFFADTAPIILPTGIAPMELFVADFDLAPGLDLVTINRGSSDLTFASNLQTPQPIALAEYPATGLASDWNLDGVGDLIIASETGQFMFLFGDTGGLLPGGTFTVAGLNDLSDIALSSLDSGVIELYATHLGQDGATLVRIVFAAEHVGQVSEVSTSEQIGIVLPVQTTEFAATLDAPLEVFAVLVFDTAATNENRTETTTPVVNGTHEGDEADEAEVETHADETNLERNTLLSGITPATAQEHLRQRPELPMEILFPSPLRWFESMPDANLQEYWETAGLLAPLESAIHPAAGAPWIDAGDAAALLDLDHATAAAPVMRVAMPTLAAYVALTWAAERGIGRKHQISNRSWGDQHHDPT